MSCLRSETDCKADCQASSAVTSAALAVACANRTPLFAALRAASPIVPVSRAALFVTFAFGVIFFAFGRTRFAAVRFAATRLADAARDLGCLDVLDASRVFARLAT